MSTPPPAGSAQSPPISRVGELEAWIDQVAAELQRLQTVVDSMPADDVHAPLEPELEAAVGRAYLAVGRSGAEVEARARAQAANILVAARTEAAALVEATRQELDVVIREAREVLHALFRAARSV